MIDTYLMVYIVICRIFELILSNKNTKKLIINGAIEHYKHHYIFIVIFHFIFILFFLIKSIYNTSFNIEYFYVFTLVQFLRYKIIYDLGEYWTTRILVINKPLVNTWLFKYFRHPNYIVVFLEVVLVCLIFNDYISLFIFSTINTALIFVRIFFEEKANSFRRKN